MTDSNGHEITEKTKITLSLRSEIILIVTVIGFVLSIFRVYAGMAANDEKIEADFKRHQKEDSLRFVYTVKSIKKDLHQIKEKLNINTDKEDKSEDY